MHVPLITTVVRKEIVNDSIKTRPVGAVVGVSGLRAGDGDVGVLVTLYDCVTRYPVSPRESDLHEGAMIRPGREVAVLPCFTRSERNHLVPVFEVSAPLL